MKVFISADMEGATGVVHRDQLVPEGKTWERARALMTGDVNAVVTGILREAPDAEVIIADAHAVMRNILIEDLHEAAMLLSGPATFENRPLGMVQGVEAGCDLAFFTGYHSRAGTPGGLLAHTWSSRTLTNVRLNGDLAGETTLNAAIAGHWDIPVGLVSGAHDLEPEADLALPAGYVFVGTKRSYGFNAALCMTPARTAKLLAEGAAEAVRRFKAGRLTPLKPRLPVTIEAEFHRREMAERAAESPGVERTEETRVSATAETVVQAATDIWRAICRAGDVQI